MYFRPLTESVIIGFTRFEGRLMNQGMCGGRKMIPAVLNNPSLSSGFIDSRAVKMGSTLWSTRTEPAKTSRKSQISFWAICKFWPSLLQCFFQTTQSFRALYPCGLSLNNAVNIILDDTRVRSPPEVCPCIIEKAKSICCWRNGWAWRLSFRYLRHWPNRLSFHIARSVKFS